MGLAKVTVQGTQITPTVRRVVDQQAQQAVLNGAKAGAGMARAVASGRTKTGRMAAIRVVGPYRSELGYIAEFVSPTKHAWYQNDGTLNSRRKRLRKPYTRMRTGRGIAPLWFLYAGLDAGKLAMGQVLGIVLKGPRR